MPIIDSHAHLGPCRVFGLNITEDQLIRTMDANGVDISIVQPYPGAPDPKEVHDRIAAMAKRYPGRIYGLASVNPYIERDRYVAEITRCVEELGFVGVKLHTIGHAVNPLTETGGLVFETAVKLGIAVNVHTGPGIPFALPSLCVPRANQYPELKIVLAHSGAGLLTADAFVAAKTCSNIYLETSWCMSDDLPWLIKELGADRVLFGTDSLTNTPVELTKYRAIGISEAELKLCLGVNAANIFGLKL
jgi:predicted TIM-barrel fold metal-dependent hydrolase